MAKLLLAAVMGLSAGAGRLRAAPCFGTVFPVWECAGANNATFGELHIYPFNDNTHVTLYGVSQTDVNITSNTVASSTFPSAGALGGQPWLPASGFGSRYFYIQTDFPVVWEIEEPIDPSGNADRQMWLSSTNGTALGNRFFGYLHTFGTNVSNLDQGEVFTMMNPNTFTAGVTVEKWNGAAWAAFKTASISPDSLWMTGGNATGTGTLVADAGDYRVTAEPGANILCHKGSAEFSDHDTFSCQGVDVNTGLSWGTAMMGLASSMKSFTVTPGNPYPAIVITASPLSGPAAYTVYQYTPTGTYPLQNWELGGTSAGTWATAACITNYTGSLAAGDSIALEIPNPNCDGVSDLSFFKVVSNNPVEVEFGAAIRIPYYAGGNWAGAYDGAAGYDGIGSQFEFNQRMSYSPAQAQPFNLFISVILRDQGSTVTLTGPANSIIGVGNDGVSNNPPGCKTAVGPAGSYAQTASTAFQAKTFQLDGNATGNYQVNITGGTGSAFIAGHVGGGSAFERGYAGYAQGSIVLSPTPSGTPSPASSPTDTPASTPTSTLVPIVSFTPTPSWTATPTASQTFTPTPTPTFILTTTPTPVFSISNTITFSPTAAPTPGLLYLRLFGSSPNPSKGDKVFIGYHITVDANVSIRIYSVSGEIVRDLPDYFMRAGNQEELWDGLNNSGLPAASGVFIFRVEADSLRGEKLAGFGKGVVLR